MLCLFVEVMVKFFVKSKIWCGKKWLEVNIFINIERWLSVCFKCLSK